MTNRVSPKVAHNRAIKHMRLRLKAQREDRQVETPAAHADRLVRILAPAAASDPAPDSPAFRSHVETAFADRFFELCSKYPAPARRS